MIDELRQFRRIGPWPPGYDVNRVTLWAPQDDVRGALLTLIRSASRSLIIAMFGFADDELAAAVGERMDDPDCYVALTLDSVQAAGAHERAILDKAAYPSNSVAIGRSEGGSIMHLKLLIANGVLTGTGSLNWSLDAARKQDNELTIVYDPVFAADARAKADLVHESILTRQAAAVRKAGQ